MFAQRGGELERLAAELAPILGDGAGAARPQRLQVGQVRLDGQFQVGQVRFHGQLLVQVTKVRFHRQSFWFLGK